jgi:nucleotide-binding universal stress UspA family protein
MIKTVLVATDGSAHADRAVAAAAEIAAKFRARLVAVHTLLHGASSATLHKLGVRKGLTKAQRDLLDSYETEMSLAMAQSGMAPLAQVPPPRELLQPIGSLLLERARAAAKKAGVKDTKVAMESGDAADDILRAAKREKADMIVLGTRGLGEIKGLLLGSVSHKVSARADCAVLTVK